VDFSGLLDIAFWVAALSLAIIVIFENMGVINGLLPDRTKFPRAFQANAVSSLTCGFLGTSPTVASAESAAGIEEGGRTGLTAVVAAVLFLLSLVIYPLLQAVPDGAIAPVLIIVGGLMARSIRNVPFQHFADWFSAYLIMALIPLTSSIADGIAIGFIVYPLLKSAQKQHRDVPLILYVIAALFALHYVLLMLITH
jgi:adenine/guanine/hypoxanthine permease